MGIFTEKKKTNKNKKAKKRKKSRNKNKNIKNISVFGPHVMARAGS